MSIDGVTDGRSGQTPEYEEMEGARIVGSGEEGDDVSDANRFRQRCCCKSHLVVTGCSGQLYDQSRRIPRGCVQQSD